MTIYIADIGSNWRFNNDQGTNWLHTAELIKAVAETGFDFVKFQAWDTPSFVHQKHPQYSTYYKKYELPKLWYKELVKLCNEFKIKPMFTAFDNVTLKLLSDLDLPSWKIASSDATCHPLISNVAQLADELYISLGNTTTEEIINLIHHLQKINYSGKVYLLHCVSKYPMKVEEGGFHRFTELRKIIEVEEVFSQFKRGWSSHANPEQAEYLANIAIAMGSEVIECHVRADNQPTKSPDYKHALTPSQLTLLKRSTTVTEGLVTSKTPLDLHEINWGRRNIFTGKRPTIDPVREDV